LKEFLKRKDIEVSVQRYAIDTLSAMTVGLFASLVIGLIIQTIGQQAALWAGESAVTVFLVTVGAFAMQLTGPAIGVAVAHALKAPPLAMCACAAVGWMAYEPFMEGMKGGGPAGALVCAIVAAECGKMVSKETKIDILVTPIVTIAVGGLVAKFVGPAVGALMTTLGQAVMHATELQPFWMGIIISMIVGFVLVAPLSSAALCIMLGLSGLAAGAATVGCCTQMIGFAVISFRANGIGGLFAQGIGTAKLQMPNVVRNPWIIAPTLLTSAVLGPVATTVFHMENIAAGAGMGTSGLVGQIGTFTAMGFTTDTLWKVLVLHFGLTAALAYVFYLFFRRIGKIHDADLKLEL